MFYLLNNIAYPNINKKGENYKEKCTLSWKNAREQKYWLFFS